MGWDIAHGQLINMAHTHTQQAEYASENAQPLLSAQTRPQAQTHLQAPSLSKKLLIVLFVFSLAITCAVTAAVTLTSYEVYEGQAEQDLLMQAQDYANDFSQVSTSEMVRVLSEVAFTGVRCTLIDSDGTVLFDNYANPETLENHSQREEVLQARASGSGALVRHSETLGSDTLYAASLVDNGAVVRLAQTRVSFASFLGNMALPLAFSLVAIFLFSLALARALTKMITRPFADIDMSQPLNNNAYVEIQPLLERVDQQRRELKGQNAELERAVSARREFTSNVSHEMKSPLQVIGGYAELMENGMVGTDDVAHFAHLIRQEATAMRDLIDDVLTLSRLDEHMSAQRMPIDMSAVVQRVCNRLASLARERGIDMHVNARAEALVYGDESLAEQMVYNLLDNAIKYNKEHGRVRVSVTTNASSGAVTLTVDDEGPGIPADLRERVFERFYRVDESRCRETGGTGLGLAIVKHAAQSLGGSVFVESSRLGGARFVVKFEGAPESEHA